MCNLDDKNIETVYERLSEYKAQGAIGIGELMINRRMDDPFIEAIFESAEKLER
ncbi:MAG: hypothetical protein J6F30_17705 [Cellulosilyticum sp.]|nr:hypothetical protein [Cellulosilyticum sp.]